MGTSWSHAQQESQIISFIFSFTYLLCMWVFTHIYMHMGQGMSVMWISEDNLWELSLLRVGSKNQTQGARLGGRNRISALSLQSLFFILILYSPGKCDELT